MQPSRGKQAIGRKRKRDGTPSRVNEEEEVAELERRALAEAPARGTQPSSLGVGGASERFDDLPLSQRTRAGLSDGGFVTMTEIQVAALPHALAGRDILGAARTGSGKTLAFLVPVLECLYRRRWAASDGLGALVVSPTRELALQIFEVLRVAGKHHAFSAGLITGGRKEFLEEQRRVVRMNILVATPGRLLQHLEQTPGFDASQLQVLVLDEADRILDMGFRDQLNSVLSYLPPQRQTLLFSATQTRSVKDLARLSLQRDSTEYVAVREADNEAATPARLVQNYVVVGLQDKLDVLYSFVKSHLRSKTIVFFNSCAQVRFVHTLFCELRPGTPLLALHGKCKQGRRTEIYLDFLKRPAAVLMATDIAARGLDFPSVDWVVQADAPEDAASYIHRAGRTARYKSGGRALLLLLPSEEEGVAAALNDKKVPVKRLTVNPEQMRLAGSVTKRAAAAVAADAEKRRLAQKAFGSYVRSIQLMPDKATFRADLLPLQEFARSLGLPAAPKVAALPAPAPAAGAGAAAAAGDGSEEAGEDAAAGGADEGVREALRQRKNVNRSLMRLKEQIKREKLQRRLERLGTPDTLAATAAAAGSGQHAAAGKLAQVAEAATAAAATAAAAPNGKDPLRKAVAAAATAVATAPPSAVSDSEDELLVAKRATPKAVGNEGSSDANGDDAGEAAAPALAAQKKKRRKAEKLRINREGIAVESSVAGARRVVFGEDGDAAKPMAPLHRFAAAASADATAACAADGSAAALLAAEDLGAASAAYVEQVKARLDAAKASDKARERERVREKHNKRRLKERAPRTDAEAHLGVQLGGGEESDDHGSGSGSDGGGGSSGSDGGDGYVGNGRGGGGYGSDSSSREAGSGNESGLPGHNVQAQEEAALRLLRGRAR